MLNWPLDRVLARREDGSQLMLLGAASAAVRSPAEVVIANVDVIDGRTRIEIDHGNG